MIQLQDLAQVKVVIPPAVGTDAYLCDIMGWCMDNGVETYVIAVWPEEIDSESEDYRFVSAWTIIDPRQRTVFKLKWAN